MSNINVKDITIATDGISTFLKNQAKDYSEINAEKYLTEDLFLENNEAMISRKCNILKNKFGLDNADDLALIRIIN